jgi:small subunit ribosomal protein S21
LIWEGEIPILNQTEKKEKEGGVDSSMPAVRLRDGESFEKAFRRFTKQCEKAGLMSDIRKHQHYEKPSEKKKRKLNAAKRKMRKLQHLLES